MRYDAEIDILEDVSLYEDEDILLISKSELEKNVLESIRNYNDDYINNSAHNKMPPDFYSEKHNLMFDVMRINDSEKKGIQKIYNPNMQKQRKIQKELNDLFNNTNISKKALTNGLLINPKPEEDYDDAHNYKQYLEQYHRVVEKHISKIPTWIEAHPHYKKGLFIFDETDLYYEYENEEDAKRPLIPGELVKLTSYHIPVLDTNFMKILLKSNLDFIVWATPYKLQIREKYKLPLLCIIELAKYDINKHSRKYKVECLRSR